MFVFAYPRGMGMGDVKLAGVLGLFLGREVGVAIFVAVHRRHARWCGRDGAPGRRARTQDKVPFGPFLALGGIVALLAGPAIVHWYLHLQGIA